MAPNQPQTNLVHLKPKKAFRQVSQHERFGEKTRMADQYKREHPEADEELRDYTDRFINYPATVADVISSAISDLPDNALTKVTATTVMTGIVVGVLKNKKAQGILQVSPNGSRARSGGTYDWAPGHNPKIPATLPVKVKAPAPQAPVPVQVSVTPALKQEVYATVDDLSRLESKLDTLLSRLSV